MGYVGKIQIGNDNTNLIAFGDVLYGTCRTPATTAEKIVVNNTYYMDFPAGFQNLMDGIQVRIKFTDGNTIATGVSLQILDTDVISVQGDCRCNPDEIICFTFEENPGAKSYWRVTSGGISSSIQNYVNTTVSQMAGTVDSIEWDSIQNIPNIVNSIDGHTGEITLSDLGLSNALHFKGIAIRNDLADGVIFDPFDSSINPRNYSDSGEDGDVVLDYHGVREYIWDGSVWKMLGFSASRIYDSDSLTSTSTDSYSWISDISQATDGTITVNKTHINILPITYGGTGINSFNKNQVIISNNPNSENHATSLTSRAYSDSESANALSSLSDNFITERYVYYGLPTINNIHNYDSTTTLFAPITAGNTTSLLVSSGAGAPIWTNNVSIEDNSSIIPNQNAITNLILGNSTNIDSDSAHSEGQIILFSSGTGSHTLKGTSTEDISYTHIMPNVTGTFVQFTENNGAGGINQPIYIDQNGTATALTYTTNRIYYGSSSTSFEATSHYISSNTMSIGIGEAPSNGATLYIHGKTDINGITTITNSTNSTTTNDGALIVSGGVGIANALYVGGILNVTGATTLNNTLSVTSTSQLTGNVGIGGTPDSGANSNILKIIGSTLISTASDNIAHLKINTDQNNNSELEFYPDSNGTGYIGKSTNRWNAGYFNSEIEIGSSINQVGSLANKINLNGNGNVLIKHGTSSINLNTFNGTAEKAEINIEDTVPTILLTSITENSSDWSIYNSSGDFIITNSSQTELKGDSNGFSLKNRLYINETQASTINTNDNYTLYVGGDQYNDGELYVWGDILPTNNANLGAPSNGSRWNALYIGTDNTYGDNYQPIYWNNGVPSQVDMILKIPFILPANSIYTELVDSAFTENTYITQIVIESGAEYLNSPISYITSTNTIRLTYNTISGQIQGHVLAIRGADVTFQ